MADLPTLSDTERIDLLENRVRSLERDCTLLGVTRKSSKTHGSRLTDTARLAAQQLLRIINMTLSDTGFDIQTAKSWEHCKEQFEMEYFGVINQIDPLAQEGGGG